MPRCPGRLLCCLICVALPASGLCAQSQPKSASSSSAKKAARPAPSVFALDDGSVANGYYRNKSLGLTCKIPEAWVLRTEEMNAREENVVENTSEKREDKKTEEAKGEKDKQPTAASGARVLLAAFSRPPEARAEDINSSILIAAENASAYPGLKDAAQYFGPITEIAKAQGFTTDEEPYEIAVGTRTLVRADFHKDVGSRVMRQSTLAMLSHGYAVSITIIAGTEDEVEELIDGLTFSSVRK